MTMTTTTAPLTPTHVDMLQDCDVNALLDIHVFKQDHWCHGATELVGFHLYQCRVCGAMDDRSSTVNTVFSGHPRLVPTYHVEQILSAMAAQDKALSICFVMSLYKESHCKTKSRLLASDLLVLVTVFSSPRLLAVTALQVLGAIDPKGYIVSKHE